MRLLDLIRVLLFPVPEDIAQEALCKSGIHDWNYIHPKITRECKCCGKFQITINDLGHTGYISRDKDGNMYSPHLASEGDRWQTTVESWEEVSE